MPVLLRILNISNWANATNDVIEVFCTLQLLFQTVRQLNKERVLIIKDVVQLHEWSLFFHFISYNQK